MSDQTIRPAAELPPQDPDPACSGSSVEVLCWSPSIRAWVIGWYEFGGGAWDAMDPRFGFDDRVTHWMPLPAPPADPLS